MNHTSLTQTGHKATVQQTYKFEFGSDNKIYSVSFRGSIQEPEIHGILESVRNSLYEKCGGSIQDYLDSHNLAYSKFTVKEKWVQITIPMKYADKFLHDPSCDIMDKWIGDTDFYYAVMDCRDWMGESCKGCYCVLAKLPSGQDGKYEHHVICQTFAQSSIIEDEKSHFAIRKDDGEHHLITLEEDCSCPVLETFGCVDLLALLCNITNITTRKQAAELANK